MHNFWLVKIKFPKIQKVQVIPSRLDFRAAGHEWAIYFENGKPKQEFLDKLGAMREILTSHSRTPVQGALT